MSKEVLTEYGWNVTHVKRSSRDGIDDPSNFLVACMWRNCPIYPDLRAPDYPIEDNLANALKTEQIR